MGLVSTVGGGVRLLLKSTSTTSRSVTTSRSIWPTMARPPTTPQIACSARLPGPNTAARSGRASTATSAGVRLRWLPQIPRQRGEQPLRRGRSVGRRQLGQQLQQPVHQDPAPDRSRCRQRDPRQLARRPRRRRQGAALASTAHLRHGARPRPAARSPATGSPGRAPVRPSPAALRRSPARQAEDLLACERILSAGLPGTARPARASSVRARGLALPSAAPRPAAAASR